MSQRALIVVGDPVISENLQEIFKSISGAGILSGMTLTANFNSIVVNQGVALTDSGVFIFQDDEVETNSIVPVAGNNYTILYRYTSTRTLGGEPASLVIENGLLNPDTFTGGVILGWVKHISGSIFDQATIIPARRFKLGLPESKLPNQFNLSLAPLSSKWAQVSGPNLSITEGWSIPFNSSLTSVTNAFGTNQTVVYHLPIVCPREGIGQIALDVDVPNTANLVLQLIDTAGNVYSGAPNPSLWTLISLPMQRRVLTVPQNLTFAAGQIAYIKLTMNMQPASTIRFKSLGFSSYTEPF
jgi:hypothetical protein